MQIHIVLFMSHTLLVVIVVLGCLYCVHFLKSYSPMDFSAPASTFSYLIMVTKYLFGCCVYLWCTDSWFARWMLIVHLLLMYIASISFGCFHLCTSFPLPVMQYVSYESLHVGFLLVDMRSKLYRSIQC